MVSSVFPVNKPTAVEFLLSPWKIRSLLDTPSWQDRKYLSSASVHPLAFSHIHLSHL